MSASFIEITAHFFAEHKRHNVTLAVKCMPGPHTGEEVLKVVSLIFKDWSVPDHKIGSIITDNGSNMIKAFKLLQLQLKTNGESEQLEGLQDEQGLSDSWNTDASHTMDTGNLDGSLSDTDDDEDMDEPQLQDVYEQEERDFEDVEYEHEMAFVGYRRLSCFAHSLQLVDEFSVFRHTIRKAKQIVSKFNKSVKATEHLIAAAGKKLIGYCPTRWSSTFLLINRLLDTKTIVTQILDENGWDGLQNSEWKILENIRELLLPFAEYTTLCSGEQYTTISSVIPIVMELKYHLEEIASKPGMATISKKLTDELNKRFDKFVNPLANGFDPYYLTATFLDPNYTLILNDNQIT